ncbi:hypothetical protein, partial [Legionella sp. 29fVS95]
MFTQALTTLKESTVIPQDVEVDIKVERAKESSHGDFATNLAMM